MYEVHEDGGDDMRGYGVALVLGHSFVSLGWEV